MLSKNSSFEFHLFSEKELAIYTTVRSGEKRLGESLKTIENFSDARFVILGISESIGPLANRGLMGAENAFSAFISAFSNTQDCMHDCACIGLVSWFGELSPEDQLSNLVLELDEFIFTVLSKYVKQEQVPIVIGGGHNNALPLIKWAANSAQIEVLNLDAHADCRSLEGRHSGNSFSYAFEQNLIKKYHVFGLHSYLLNTASQQFLIEKQANYTFYEDYIDGSRNLLEDVAQLVLNQSISTRLGLEIDMDCIADMPSSAISPSGWRLDDIRAVTRKLSKSSLNIAYLHLTEAAPKNDAEKTKVGKALSYLVRDFINLK